MSELPNYDNWKLSNAEDELLELIKPKRTPDNYYCPYKWCADDITKCGVYPICKDCLENFAKDTSIALAYLSQFDNDERRMAESIVYALFGCEMSRYYFLIEELTAFLSELLYSHRESKDNVKLEKCVVPRYYTIDRDILFNGIVCGLYTECLEDREDFAEWLGDWIYKKNGGCI